MPLLQDMPEKAVPMTDFMPEIASKGPILTRSGRDLSVFCWGL